jgi:hypothetical protein
MGNSVKIKYSKARKYFVCDKPFELVEHPDGIYAKIYYLHMGDPLKYERLCFRRVLGRYEV